MDKKIKTKRGKPKLWNPNAATLWSAVFSTAFGAILHAINWENMGLYDKAKANKTWAWSIIILLFVTMNVILIVPPPLNKVIDYSLRFVMFISLFVWYFTQGKPQVKFVKEKYKNNYEKRRWANPLLIAIGCFLGFVVFATLLSFIYSIIFGIEVQ